MKKIALLLCCLMLVKIGHAQNQPSLDKAIPKNGFLRNVGQVRDQDNKPVPSVYYQANIGNEQFFITRYGLSIVFAHRNTLQKRRAVQERKKMTATNERDSIYTASYRIERVDIVLKNAFIDPAQIAETSLAGSPVYNMYTDSLGIMPQSLQLKSEILIKNVYPGIDWKIYIKEVDGRQIVKYDFIVHPGADPDQIKLQYSRNARMKMANNEIAGETNIGQVREGKPFSYLQKNKKEVQTSYTLKNNQIGFKVNNYDKGQTLVIDPSIFWLTYLSTSDKNVLAVVAATDVETDKQGNIFVQLSISANTPFITKDPGNGAYYQNVTTAPNGSMVIMKFTPEGQLLWSTFFGAEKAINSSVMTVDKFDNIVALGYFPEYQSKIPLLDNGGFFDRNQKKYFITKFSNDGKLIWSSFYANFSTYPMDMSYDINGNVYVTGWSESADFPLTDPGNGAYFETASGIGAEQLLFISQFDASNRLTWSTRFYGENDDYNARICTDKIGNIYIGGNVRSAKYLMVDNGGYFNPKGWGAIITKFNAARKMTWSTFLPTYLNVGDITVDDSCNIYITQSQYVLKFDSLNKFVFQKNVNTTRMHFWEKINYDKYHDQVQLLGVMNDPYWDFPSKNTNCGSFYKESGSMFKYPTYTMPIFATLDHNGAFTYLTLADWPYEYYDYNEMAVDPSGNMVYVFGHQKGGSFNPNPQLTDPGNGAYFNSQCCSYVNSQAGLSSLLMKLTYNNELFVTPKIAAPTTCGCNGTAELSVTCGADPYKYEWSNGATTAAVTGLCSGTYMVKVTDANGLSVKKSIVVPNPPGSITAARLTTTPENCDKANAMIFVNDVTGGTAPFTYAADESLYQATPKFTGLDSGTHILHIKDANGCSYHDTLLLARIPGPQSFASDKTSSTCKSNDGTLRISNISGGETPYTFILENAGTNHTGIFNTLAPADYQIKIIDNAGCELLSKISIDKTLPPSDAVISVTDDHCDSKIGSLTVTNVAGGKSPFSFSADNVVFTSGSISNLNAGTYKVYIKDDNGCVLSKESVVLKNQPGPAAVNIDIENAYCGKTSGGLNVASVTGGISPYIYAIDAGEFGTAEKFSDVAPGGHRFSVKDKFNCAYTKDFEIKYRPLAKISISPEDTTVCYEETLQLYLEGDKSKVKNINWSIPASGSSAFIKVRNNQRVTAAAIDENDCPITANAIINVKACSTPENCLHIPNAFTPNSDGKNETIGPVTLGCQITDLAFQIYSRWGEVVFETNDKNKRWDGYYKGLIQPGGVYIYTCSYITDDGVKRFQKGAIILIR
ncbi:DUF7948 domain-containing protein [Pinibacter aurantiacus]|uniref:Gliding motility-associated C-terminal domain-containing protein n=1 Tax=Pinibacter aurantiacus TaxID=2851599 RepID=A0A9E2SCN5_9BACT|nr:gliding motility-associated C-terminal domain-containing protein [Pinibacter aurantiacus]MBV4358679.1 gliding motility-associated C-terminal domain-containing protein [Pinibacter aurantiacus]